MTMPRSTLVFSLLLACSAASSSNFRGHASLQREAEVASVTVNKAYSGVFDVPTASRCCVIIICQYMIIYVALAIVRTYQEFTATAAGKVEASLRAAAQTMTYGPMLCVLFIACRMRVEFLSNGTDAPQIWVQRCMYGVTYAVLASTLLVLLIPLLTGKSLPLKEGSCEMAAPEGDDNKTTLMVLTIARYLILLGLYGGLAGIIVGINIYLPPGATDLSKLPRPAPAVFCTMVLAVVFFLTQLIIAFCRTYEEFKGVAFPRLVSVMQEAATTVEFGPMLAIVFLTARMRALQHDSQPQVWAQDCMYAATSALCVTTLLAIAIPFTVGGNMVTNPQTGEKTFETPDASPALTYTLLALRYICMIGFYGGTAGVIYSIYVFEAPGGPEATLPVSPAAHCVANLACQFFFVYGMMTVMLSASAVTGVQCDKWRLFSAVESAKSTLGLAPMLAILFVTTRMYALLITDKKGAPQAWAQDGMYMATWAMLISLLVCLGMGLVMDEVKQDEDGNVVNKFSNQYVAAAMTFVRYFTMILLYGGITLVIYGLFVMTPETANGKGSIPLISDVINATPMGGPPPGAGDMNIKGPPAHDSRGAQGFF